MQNSYFVLAVLVVFGVVLVPALGSTFASAPGDVHTGEETVPISTNSWTEVNESDVESWLDNETVYDDGSVVNESEYRWATTNGSIRAVEGGSLENASEVRVEYAFRRHGSFLEAGQGIMQGILTVVAALTFFVGAAVLLSAAAALEGGGR